MENDYNKSSQSAELLDALRSDRETLATKVRISRTLLAAYGGIGAWFVANAATTSPGTSYQPPREYWLAIVATLVISHFMARETGIKFRQFGGRAAWAIAGIIGLCLGMYSVSLALVSLGITWAVTITSILTFVGTALLANVAYQSAIAKLHD